MIHMTAFPVRVKIESEELLAFQQECKLVKRDAALTIGILISRYMSDSKLKDEVLETIGMYEDFYNKKAPDEYVKTIGFATKVKD